MGSSIYRLPDGRELEMRREFIRVESISATKPDPSWTYTDPAGHEHRYVDGRVPTVEDVADGEPYWCDTCWDEHQDTKTVCRRCGGEVDPKRLRDTGSHYMPGVMELYIDGEYATIDQFNAALAENGIEERVQP